jgi:hypothetical protein
MYGVASQLGSPRGSQAQSRTLASAISKHVHSKAFISPVSVYVNHEKREARGATGSVRTRPKRPTKAPNLTPELGTGFDFNLLLFDQKFAQDLEMGVLLSQVVFVFRGRIANGRSTLTLYIRERVDVDSSTK